MANDNVEQITATMTLTEGWNLIGCFWDPLNLDPITVHGDNECFNVMYDGTTSSSGPIVHTTADFVDADDLIT